MLAKRIIPCLDIEDGRVVKGVQFRNIRDAGDPVELARHYNAQQADELVFLDIGASYRSREIMLEVVEKVSREVFIPLTVGGGIRTIEDMRRALQAGADKVAVCTAAIKQPQLLTEGAERFGAQCMVLSIDARRVGERWLACTHGGRRLTDLEAIEWAQRGEALGAGEILLNSIDMDGTRSGYDLELTRRVAEAVHIPVIASGGAGTLEHIRQAAVEGKADAVLLASLLHFGEFTVGDIKTYLKQQGVPVRW
ncbi:MAG: imidazole glycerol phosphate synthase subunit HisF [Calditrichaeota bacterium]|nr:MAG: imidazole glycerol phosphate synthase subunit HisF [Calditrichota bacterium]